MLTQYNTVTKEAEDEISVKKSRFIANLFLINSEAEFQEKINYIKKKYRDAKHHVFAFRLSDGTERYSDDGEPSGTAGVPMLDILRGAKLFNIMVVVTRYFGGTLLGTGGLVRAYSDATKLVLDGAEIEEKILATEYKIEVPYNNYNSVQHYCSKNNIIIVDSSFLDTITVNIVLKYNDEEKTLRDLNEMFDGKLNIMKVRQGFYI